MKKVSIIGFGRFGQTLYRLMKNDFDIVLYSRGTIVRDGLTKYTKIAQRLEEVYDSEVIFYAIPISSFADVIASHKKYFRAGQLLIDVLSVKVHPKKLMRAALKGTKTQALLTHPMFGPDSSKDGFAGLPIILDRSLCDDKYFSFWQTYFTKKHLHIVEMSADEHDKLAADSQGLTHFIGRLLEQYNFVATPIDSLGAKQLHQIKEQTCHDMWQLFTDLQQYNPYTKNMRLRLGNAYDALYNKLLPKQADPRFVTFGIQGGKGSFNEAALQIYLREQGLLSTKTVYLYTSENVLRQLHEGNIDYGLFAIHNATGGIVGESVSAMAKYKFAIINEFEMLIRHSLLKRKDVPFGKITTIMAHSQNFKQCQATLSEKYPMMALRTGEGELMDTAKAAAYLAEGKLPKATAILGPKILAKLYDLDIVDEDLQDNKDNITSFLVVKR